VRRNWLLSLALCVAVAGLIRGLTAGALWDPHDTSVAELARRIGLNLLGGGRLAVGGADNSLPIRADLGRAELPFTSIALGFRLFGLSEWAGRLPLTLWSLLGLAVLYAALGQLWERRAALFAVLVLATTPLFFLQARALFGDAPTFATFVTAWSGLSVACLANVSRRARAGFAALGVLGLYAGFWCRGPIVNVAVPALSVGLVGSLMRRGQGRVRFVSWAVTLLGLAALGLGVVGLSLASRTGDYSVFVGSALAVPPELPTFDVALGNLAHAAFPWSAAAPLALAWLSEPEDASDPAHAVALAAALGLALSLATWAWLAPALGNSSLPGVCCYAVLVAGGLRRLETGRLRSRLLGLVVAALAIVIGFDLHTYPEKALSAYAVLGATLPDSLRAASDQLWLGGALTLALLTALLSYESQVGNGARPVVFRRAEYGRVLTGLQQVWDGNLVFAFLVLEAGLVGFLLLSAVSERLVVLPQLDAFGSFSRKLVASAAVGAPLLPLVPLGAMLLRDSARVVFELPLRLRSFLPTRAEGILLAFAAFGSITSLGFYPALSRQLSPQEAFERYRELRATTEPLALLGQQAESARYQGAASARSLEGAPAALTWLTESAQRRWLVLRQGDLAELNAQFRGVRQHNLPILDARSSEILLASNQLRAGERDQNPLAELVLDAPPRLQHPLSAVLGDKLAVLGWSVIRADGALATSLSPTEHYRFAIYYRVLAPLSGSWQTFVHIDGLQRRFNADHEPLNGKYPLKLWRQNDVLVDETSLTLEPNFSPGPYRVYFGLFAGEQRLHVSAGPSDEDRIVAGTVQVR
jgi:hypothetical protein